MDLNANGTIHVPDTQAPVTDLHRRIAKLITDYDPHLEVHFIPPGSRGAFDVKPWAIVHRPPGKPAYYVMYVEDLDERVVAKLWSADNNGKDVLTEMEKLNEVKEALLLQAQADEMAEAHAMAASVLRSRKFHYKHNGVDFGELGRR